MKMLTVWAARPRWIRFLIGDLTKSVAFFVIWLLVVLGCPQPAFAPETECSLTARMGTSIFELLVEVPVASYNDTSLCMNYSIKNNTWKFRVGCPDGHCVLVDGYCSYDVMALPMLNRDMQSFILLQWGNSYNVYANASVGYCYRLDGVGGESSSTSTNSNSGSDNGSGHGSDDGSANGSGRDSDEDSGHGSVDGSGNGSIDGSGIDRNIDNDSKSPIIITVVVFGVTVVVMMVIFIPVCAVVMSTTQPATAPKVDIQCLDEQEPKKGCHNNIPQLVSITSFVRSMDRGPREQSSDMNVASPPPTNFSAVSEPPKAAEAGSAQSIVTEDTGPTSSTGWFVGGRCNGLHRVDHHRSSNICYKLPCASGSGTEEA